MERLSLIRGVRSGAVMRLSKASPAVAVAFGLSESIRPSESETDRIPTASSELDPILLRIGSDGLFTLQILNTADPRWLMPLKDCSYPGTRTLLIVFIINMNASLPSSQKFIIHVLDSTRLFVQPHAAEMIRTAMSEFRDQNSYEKPA